MSSGEHCDFKDMLDLMICNRLVCGINDARIQDLTKQGHHTLRSLDVKEMSTVECYRCGRNHYATKCSFKEHTCHACKKKGHLARMCCSCKKGFPLQKSTQPHKQDSARPSQKSSLGGQRLKYPRHILDQYKLYEDNEDNPSSAIFSHETSDYPLFTLPGKVTPIVVTVKVNDVDLQMEIDTSASVSLIN